MSTHSRPKTRRQLRHPASRSKSHQRDKREGEARRKTAWLGVKAPPRPSPRRSFPGLDGHEYRFDGQRWHRCHGPEEFADYLEEEARRRSYYMSRTTRKGVAVDMKRPVATPLEIQTTTLPPWVSDWLAAEIAAGRDPRPQLIGIRNRWLAAAQRALDGQRHVLGYAWHVDTDDPHLDLVLSRQDGRGGRIGETGLGLVGPWLVGCDRQQRAGAKINADKQRQVKRSIANFRHRYGEKAKPLDITLARALDAAAEEVIGPALRPYREAYAARVPELERQHAEAQLSALQAAEKKLRERVAPPAPEIPLGR
jgi:hypothetical protein